MAQLSQQTGSVMALGVSGVGGCSLIASEDGHNHLQNPARLFWSPDVCNIQDTTKGAGIFTLTLAMSVWVCSMLILDNKKQDIW